MNAVWKGALGSLAMSFVACSNDAPPERSPEAVDAGNESGKGPVFPVPRYEPDARLDFDNVASYGPSPTLRLPEPPRSGFRLVAPPEVLGPGEEREGCRAWAYPPVTHANVYAARIYTNGGLHHGNLYGVAIAAAGPSPYPGCAAEQGDAFSKAPDLASGSIPDILFANSTQIAGTEAIAFQPGMAFHLVTEGRELTTSIHYLNTADEELTTEVVYDFYTMPAELVVHELAPYVFQNHGFEIPARTQGKITTTCDVTGEGTIVSIMPHTHERAVAFDAELLRSDGTAESIYHDGSYDTESEITVLDEPIDLTGFTRIRHTCTVDNDLDRPIVWGIGDDEMCTLFGYMYPPSAQQIGFVPERVAPGVEPPCVALPIGQLRR